MKVLDPGHVYELAQLDRESYDRYPVAHLTFVKRVGEGYPGNEGEAHAGHESPVHE